MASQQSAVRLTEVSDPGRFLKPPVWGFNLTSGFCTVLSVDWSSHDSAADENRRRHGGGECPLSLHEWVLWLVLSHLCPVLVYKMKMHLWIQWFFLISKRLLMHHMIYYSYYREMKMMISLLLSDPYSLSFQDKGGNPGTPKQERSAT